MFTLGTENALVCGDTVSLPDICAGNNGVLDATPTATGSRVTVRYRLLIRPLKSIKRHT
jgi:hypothetical protein